MTNTQYWEGRIRDRCLDALDEASDEYYNGWVEFTSDKHGFAIFYYDRDGEGQLQHIIKCNQIKPIRKKPKDRYFSFKYTEGTYFEGTDEPIYELTYHGSRNDSMSFRECVKDKCLELPLEGRYPKRNNPDPERKPDAVVIRHCETCKIWCTGIESWEAHNQGKDHKKNSNKTRFGAPVSSKPPPPVYKCDTCDKECTGDDPWFAHLNGAPHKRKVAQASGQSNRRRPKSTDFRCDICNVDATDQEQLQKHLDGKPHKKKMAKALYEEELQKYPRANALTDSQKKEVEQLKRELEDRMVLIDTDDYFDTRSDSYANEQNSNRKNDDINMSQNQNFWSSDSDDDFFQSAKGSKSSENGRKNRDPNKSNYDRGSSSSSFGDGESRNDCSPMKNSNNWWHVGDIAYAPYDDGRYYEITIKEIDEKNRTVLVLYNGYSEQAELYIDELCRDEDWN